MIKQLSILCLLSLGGAGIKAQPSYDMSRLQREKLARGVVAVRQAPSEVAVSWRYLSSDSMDESFDIYKNGLKITNTPIRNSTFFIDSNNENKESTYTVKAIKEGSEASYTLPINAPIGYINIPLERPDGGVTPSGEHYTYSPNDVSVGDVDGDGLYELFLKWTPSNARDNSHDGYTGPTLIDCYKISGERLWRVNLGNNIRSGAHYVQMMVFDLNNDGEAEMVVKTGDGSIDGIGNIIGDPKADHRTSNGRILSGAEYLTIFNGKTGKAMHTIDYIPERGDVRAWGDPRANRSDRFLACIAYLDGINPSVVMCRGYYTRTVLAAYDWDGTQLTNKWVFDSKNLGSEAYAGQGNHNLRVGDVDGDGCDEIVYGQCVINNDGTGLYSTGMGHGDAMHLTKFHPEMHGLQVWGCHENKRDGATLRDAKTGEIIQQYKSNMDDGRCLAADIDPTSPGVEMWSFSTGGIRNIHGELITESPVRIPTNMAIWWDGDLLRELLDKNRISKYNWEQSVVEPLAVFIGALSNNGSKSTPSLQGDILGDWREEVILRSEDNNALRIYVSTIPTPYRFHTFLEDPIYRISIATQGVAYNQPTQPGFYFGPELRGTSFRGFNIPEDAK